MNKTSTAVWFVTDLLTREGTLLLWLTSRLVNVAQRCAVSSGSVIR